MFTLNGRGDYLILFKPHEGQTPKTTDMAGFIDLFAGGSLETEAVSVKSWTAGFALVAESFRQGSGISGRRCRAPLYADRWSRHKHRYG